MESDKRWTPLVLSYQRILDGPEVIVSVRDLLMRIVCIFIGHDRESVRFRIEDEPGVYRTNFCMRCGCDFGTVRER